MDFPSPDIQSCSSMVSLEFLYGMCCCLFPSAMRYYSTTYICYYFFEIEDEISVHEYDDEDDNVITRKCNIRGTDYLIGDNNSIYDVQTEKTIGKFDSKNGVILYNNCC